MRFRRTIFALIAVTAVAGMFSSCGLRRHKYDNPIAKNTQQPDKVLFDKAINDIEHSRFEVARLTLQTMINTYDTSEFLAKAKLAIADSWYREGGSHGLAQAEAEYKDFILFYPTMEEAAEAQERVCDIHYKQMEKADRDPMHAIRAEDECRQLLVQFPNSKFAPETQQKLRNIQEVLADHEYRTAVFYHHKGSYPAAANRFIGTVEQYPLFSQADEALWLLGDSYTRMGDRFEDKAAAAFTRIVKDYPLSDRADSAKERLTAMNRPVPQADPVAYARMKYEIENRTNPKFISHVWGALKKSPDTSLAAKSGTPAMTGLRPTIPASVPQVPGTTTGVGSDVTVSTVGDSKELDNRPDARLNPPAAGAAATAAPAATNTAAGATGNAAGAAPGSQAMKPADAAPAATAQQPFATNHPLKPNKKQKKSKKKSDEQSQSQPAAQAAPATPQAQPPQQ
ncbi:MAG: outer membrane protein assembly factor BamD [Bryobacteraceae bacterium]